MFATWNPAMLSRYALRLTLAFLILATGLMAMRAHTARADGVDQTITIPLVTKCVTVETSETEKQEVCTPGPATVRVAVDVTADTPDVSASDSITITDDVIGSTGCVRVDVDPDTSADAHILVEVQQAGGPAQVVVDVTASADIDSRPRFVEVCLTNG